MNIGKWIVVAFVLFAVFIGILVTVCVRQDINLVSKDYYKDELVYQEQIDRLNNTQDLSSKPAITNANDSLMIKFNEPIEEGYLKLFCPSNPTMDRNIVLNLSTHNQQDVDVSSLQRGLYRAKLYWTTSGKKYFVEEVIFL